MLNNIIEIVQTITGISIDTLLLIVISFLIFFGIKKLGGKNIWRR